MRKKSVSLILCLAMILSTVAFCIPAEAVTVSADKLSNVHKSINSPVVSADDFSWDNASVYFMLTDRFNNGNTSNDHSYGRTLDENGEALAGWDTAPCTFHGGDFAGVTQKLNEGYFTDLGINAIWISAPYEQIHGYVASGPNNTAHYGYHGYYALDYTETDANFGTKEEFATMVETAHKKGIRIIMDVVMNHAGYLNIKDMDEFNYGTLLDGAKDFEYKYANVGNAGSFVNYKSSVSDWSRWWGTDWLRSDVAGYSLGGGDLQMCLAGLPDFRTESTKQVTIPQVLQTKWKQEGTYEQKVAKYGESGTVSDYLTKWISEWVATYGVDGFRCDTAKHVELPTWKKLKTSCVAALKEWRVNNPDKAGSDWDEDFWMTGESWGYNVGYGSYYSEGGFDSMINFSFSGGGVNGISTIDGTYQYYANTINSDSSPKDFNALTYISSHDSNLARNDLMYQGSAFQLMPGEIQIYYGDETSRGYVPNLPFDGNGGPGHCLRSDMNWDSINQTVLFHWQKVGQFRNRHLAVGAGTHKQITAYNSSTGYTFARSYNKNDVTDNVVATIGAPANKDIAIDVSSIWSNGTTLANAYDDSIAEVVDGKVTFNSGANGTILVEEPQSGVIVGLRGATSFYDSQMLSVVLRGADYAMVSVNGGEEFKVIDGEKFSVGADIEVGTTFDVTITATNAEDTASKTYTFKKKDPAAITTIYFDNTQYKWGAVNAYIYDESTGSAVANAAWPGVAMTYDDATGYYTIEVPEGLENGSVIFNAGSGSANRYPAEGQKGLAINETDMLFSYGNKWQEYTGQVIEKPTAPDPSQSITVYYDNSKTSYATPYIYYWASSSTTGDVSWPGVAMTKYKDNVWKATVPNGNDKCIFSNNGASQTGNLTIPGADYIYNGSWSEYADAETIPVTTAPVTTQPITTQVVTSEPTTTEATEPVTTIAPATTEATEPATTAPVTTEPETTQPKTSILVGDADGDGIISVSDTTIIQRYCAERATLDNNALVAADVNQDGVITVMDASYIQHYLIDMSEDDSMCGKVIEVQAPTQPTTQAESTTTPTVVTEPVTTATTAPAPNYVYYKNTNNWSKVNAYYWSDSNKAMMTWPGKAMESIGNNVYRIEVPTDATMIIFNNGSGGNGNQTSDLKLEGANKIYDNGVWSDYTE